MNHLYSHELNVLHIILHAYRQHWTNDISLLYFFVVYKSKKNIKRHSVETLKSVQHTHTLKSARNQIIPFPPRKMKQNHHQQKPILELQIQKQSYTQNYTTNGYIIYKRKIFCLTFNLVSTVEDYRGIFEFSLVVLNSSYYSPFSFSFHLFHFLCDYLKIRTFAENNS